MEGHPFLLDVEVDRSLAGDRLTVTTTATNAGVGPCAYGAGQHPHLSLGTGLADQWTLQLEARPRIGSDDERHLPTGAEAVDRTTYDFRGVPDPELGDIPAHEEGLVRFKSGFGAQMVRYAGEFDLPLSKSWHWLWTQARPKLTAALKKKSAHR